MSWSTSAQGKPAEVAQTVASTLSGYKCSEPEESIKQKAGEAIAACLAAYPDDKTVAVSAYGSQQGADGSGKAVNTLSISITVPPA